MDTQIKEIEWFDCGHYQVGRYNDSMEKRQLKDSYREYFPNDMSRERWITVRHITENYEELFSLPISVSDGEFKYWADLEYCADGNVIEIVFGE